MVDLLPNVEGDNGLVREAVPVVQFTIDGQPTPQSSPTVKEFVAYAGAGITATQYALLVDLSDTVNFPHTGTTGLNLFSTFFFVDKASNTIGQVQLGVVTRVDGTNADIQYLQGVSFQSASDRQIARDRIFEYPINTTVASGTIEHAATLLRETNVAAVNSATPLATSIPSVTAAPEVGDLIVKLDYTSGAAFTASVSGQYAGIA